MMDLDMTATIADLVRAVVARTKLPKTFVEQRARELQNAGWLPVSVGTNYPTVKPKHLANLLIALAADRVRNAPTLLNKYRALARLDGIERGEEAGNAIDNLVASIWSGDSSSRSKVISIVKTWAEVSILSTGDKAFAGEHFYTDDQIMEFHSLDSVRSVLEIPGNIIAEIGFDLGFRGCANAG